MVIWLTYSGAMFIEDLIRKIADVQQALGAADRKFVRSVSRRAEKGEALTTRQGWAFLNIMRKNPIYAEISMKKEVFDDILRHPQWKIPLVPSVELRSEVRHLGDNLIGFRCSISKAEAEFTALNAIYSNGMRIVALRNASDLSAVIEFIGRWGFQMDRETEQFLAEALKFSDTPTKIVLADDQIVIDVPNEHVFAQFALHVLGATIL